VEVKNVQAVPTVCNHGPLKAHRGSRVFIFEKHWIVRRFARSPVCTIRNFPVWNYWAWWDIPEESQLLEELI
jgi:hypothetical protein